MDKKRVIRKVKIVYGFQILLTWLLLLKIIKFLDQKPETSKTGAVFDGEVLRLTNHGCKSSSRQYLD